MEFNIDSFQKYNTASAPQDEVLHDVKMTYLPRSAYALEEVMQGWGMTHPEFAQKFQYLGNKAIPKYRKGENVMYWFSKRVAAALDFPLYVAANAGRQLVVTIDDPELSRQNTFNVDIEDATTIANYVNTQFKLQLPHICNFVVDGTELHIKYNKHVKLTLPYVLNNYTVDCTEDVEQWPITISYQSAEGVAKITKSALVVRAKGPVLQGQNIKAACLKETGEDLTFQLLGGDGEPIKVDIDKKLEVVIPIELARLYKIPTILKYGLDVKNLECHDPYTATHLDNMRFN